MEITNVRLYPVETEDNPLISFASIVFNDEFVIHNLRIVETDEKVIIAMPDEQHGDGHRDLAHPITDKCRKQIQRALISAYNTQAETEHLIANEKIPD